MNKTNRKAWSMKAALILIRLLQPEAMEAGYYLALAGGVLNKGKSANDLDLVAMPRTPGAKQWRLWTVLHRYGIVAHQERGEDLGCCRHFTCGYRDKDVEIAIVKPQDLNDQH